MAVMFFDEVYKNCIFRVDIDDATCTCNNGYICNAVDNSEECEGNPLYSKCYSFSCPLIDDGVSIKEVEESDDFDVDDIEFEDGISVDSEELVLFHPDAESREITSDDVISEEEIFYLWIVTLRERKGLSAFLCRVGKRRGAKACPPFGIIYFKKWITKHKKMLQTKRNRKGVRR